MYYPLSCPSKLGLASFRLSFTFFSLFLSSFSTSLSCVWVCVTGRVCEGGLLRKPPLKCAYVNSARNYIFMRDTSLRALNYVQCVHACTGLRPTQGRIPRGSKFLYAWFAREARHTCELAQSPDPVYPRWFGAFEPVSHCNSLLNSKKLWKNCNFCQFLWSLVRPHVCTTHGPWPVYPRWFGPFLAFVVQTP